MSDFQTEIRTTTEGSLQAAHPLPTVDLSKKLKADDGTYTLGTLLKEGAAADAGTLVRWVQGADAAGAIAGVFAHHQDLDTAKQSVGLVRVFGPVAKAGLVAATAADGSATAAPNQEALDALEALSIYAL